MNTQQVKQFIRQPYAWPGGYPMFLIMDDGGAICKDCARAEWPLICGSTRSNTSDGWRAEGVGVNWEDADLICDHCSNQIESAYA